jgi:hypothetical protein
MLAQKARVADKLLKIIGMYGVTQVLQVKTR